MRTDPTNTSARLALGDRVLRLGDLRDASAQYLAVLRLEPDDAHARASLGLVLYLSGRPRDGLRAERDAVSEDPSYAQAHAFETLILFRGLARNVAALRAAHAYLRLEPNGPDARMVRSLIAEIRCAS